VTEQQPHRRRRRRATRAQGAPEAHATPRPGPDAAPGGAAAPNGDAQPKPRRRQRPARDPAEHGLRDIVGAGRSQLGVSGALRGRDVNRPTDEDIAEAEETVAIVRRHWQPPSESPPKS
jgi:hypothetical protein